MPIERKISSAVLDQPIHLCNIYEKKWYGRKVEHEIHITGATASTLFLVSGLIASLKVRSDKKGESSQVFDLVGSNLPNIIQFLSIVIHNKPGTPPKWLKNGLMTQFSIKELKQMTGVVYGRLGVEDFFGIMELVHEFQIVESPNRTPEAKAHGQAS